MGSTGGNGYKQRMTGRKAALGVAGFLLLSPLFMAGFIGSRSRRDGVMVAVGVGISFAVAVGAASYALGGVPEFDLFASAAARPQDTAYEGLVGTLVWLMAFSLVTLPASGYVIGKASRGSGNGVVATAFGAALFFAPMAGFMQVKSGIDAGMGYTRGATDMYGHITVANRVLSADPQGPLDRDVHVFALWSAMMRAVTSDPEYAYEPTREAFEKWKAKRDEQLAATRAQAEPNRP